MNTTRANDPDVKCPLCGTEFHGESCHGACPMASRCAMVRCPSCGYELPDPSRSFVGRAVAWLQARFQAAPSPQVVAAPGPAPVPTTIDSEGAVSLDTLPVGETGRVVNAGGDDAERAGALAAFGLVPGTEVRLKQRRPALVVEVGETVLAMDQSVAAGIQVTPARRALDVRLRAAVATAATLLLLVANVAPAAAGHPLHTDDATTVSAGTAEVEVALSGERTSHLDAGSMFDMALVGHVGLLPRLDLGASLLLCMQAPGDDLTAAGGTLVPGLDLKLAVLSAGAFGLALRADYGAPGIGASPAAHGVALSAIGSWRLPSRDGESDLLGIDLNVAATADELRANAQPVAPPVLGMSASASIGGAPAQKLWLAGEAVVHWQPGAVALAGQVAAIWSLRDELVVSAGVGPSWESGGRIGYAARVGMTVAVGGE